MLADVLLWLLVPYAIALVWLLVKIGPNSTAVAWCALVTVPLVWALLHVIYVSDLLPVSAEEAFASVEYIMRDVKGTWLMRYLVTTYGPLLPIMYFGVCWLAALAWSRFVSAKRV